MKTSAVFLFSLFLTFGAYANDYDCATKLSLYDEAAKAKDYDTAYNYLQELRAECPTINIAIYQHGERIYKHRIENASGDGKEAELNELKKLIDERMQHFPNNSKKGSLLSSLAQVMYDNKIGDKNAQFDAFDRAYTEDKETFIQPKSLYTYFSLGVDLFKGGNKDLQEVFDLYDELIDKVVTEKNSLAEKITPLIEKEENQKALGSKEQTELKRGETYLKGYSQIETSINAKLGDIADCENLIPLYSKDFDAKKTDAKWLERAGRRLSAKDCEDPLFFDISEALHNLKPSASSALYLGQLADQEGNASKAMQYYNEAAELETDENKKANIYFKIAENYRGRGNLSRARNNYRKALQYKPSLGAAYLRIAAMYAVSVNDCGKDLFERKAVNWLAAEVARTAARVDPSIASSANSTAESYMQRAPTKQEIFTSNKEGQTISFSCWIGESVRVPDL